VKFHRGQVSVYLALVLFAVIMLVMMNVGVFLAVSAKNKTMNAGDAAAIAVAKMQGEILNRIGEDNILHLKAALKGDLEQCTAIQTRQLRACFLDPLEGIRLGSEAAAANGIEIDDGMGEILSRHVRDIRLYYLTNPRLYPEPWEGAWEEYAQRLELAIAGGVRAGPDNACFMNGARDHHLIDKGFYEAVLGRNWCWFKFNAPGLISSYSSFRDWAPLPTDDEETRRRSCVNSEIYSLHLTVRTGSALDLLGTNIVMKLTGATLEEIALAPLLSDISQQWFFYDENHWRRWWEIDPTGPWNFPVYGKVHPQYDIKGAAAVCRVSREIPSLVSGTPRIGVWSAAAKPFGSVENDEEKDETVVSMNKFVTSAFSSSRLVPLDSVGGNCLSTADPVWMRHIMDHLPDYALHGPRHFSDCMYCSALVMWEKDSFRTTGRIWLKYHSEDCVRPAPGNIEGGGTRHGH
jgi:hypothetical protein